MMVSEVSGRSWPKVGGMTYLLKGVRSRDWETSDGTGLFNLGARKGLRGSTWLTVWEQQMDTNKSKAR
jgi:hypothetical protein